MPPPATLEVQAFNIHAPLDDPQFAAAYAAAAVSDAVAEAADAKPPIHEEPVDPHPVPPAAHHTSPFESFNARISNMSVEELRAAHYDSRAWLIAAGKEHGDFFEKGKTVSSTNLEQLKVKLRAIHVWLKAYFEGDGKDVQTVDATQGQQITAILASKLMYRFIVLVLYNDHRRGGLLSLGQQRTQSEIDAKQTGVKHPWWVEVTTAYNDPNLDIMSGASSCSLLVSSRVLHPTPRFVRVLGHWLKRRICWENCVCHRICLASYP